MKKVPKKVHHVVRRPGCRPDDTHVDIPVAEELVEFAADVKTAIDKRKAGRPHQDSHLR